MLNSSSIVQANYFCYLLRLRYPSPKVAHFESSTRSAFREAFAHRNWLSLENPEVWTLAEHELFLAAQDTAYKRLCCGNWISSTAMIAATETLGSLCPLFAMVPSSAYRR